MLLQENDYSVSVIYVLSVLFGTWPIFPTEVYSINSNTNNNNNRRLTRPVRSWFKRYFVCLLWLMITVGSHLYYLTAQWMHKTELTTINVKVSKYDAIVKKLLIAENWTINLTAIINIVTVHFTSQYIPSLFHIFQKTEQWLESTLDMQRISQIRRTQCYKNFLWLLSVYSIIFITMIMEYSGLLSVHRGANFLNIISQDLGKLSMMTFDLQFTSLCIILKNRFSCINKLLQDFNKLSTMKQKRNFINNNLFAYTNPRHCNSYTEAIDHNRLPEIFKLNVNHRLLCDAIDKMNRTYRIQVTLNIAVSFFNTVCVLFTTISEYRANLDWTLWITGVLWVTYYVLRMIMVCASATTVIEQAYKPKTYLSCLNDRNLAETQKYQINHFLRRLANTDIRFTFYGLIVINTSLLSSACVGVITYLVIALQYSYS